MEWPEKRSCEKLFQKSSLKCGDTMKEGPYIKDSVENCLEYEAWASIQDIAEGAESFEEFVSVNVEMWTLCAPNSLQIMQSVCK